MSDLDIVYVSSSSTETIENGNIEYPFRTILSAFENLNSGGTMRLKCGDTLKLQTRDLKTGRGGGKMSLPVDFLPERFGRVVKNSYLCSR